MPGKFFGNQSAEQVVKHLERLLDKGVVYNLEVDPLFVRFTICETVRRVKPKKDPNYKKPGKIRKRKKGRTVNLKGREY